MAQDIRNDFSGSTTAITITINSVADAGNVTATAVDLGAQAPLGIGIHAVLDGAAGSTAEVEWYMLWSEDNSAFTAAAVAQLQHVTTMQGTTAFDEHFFVPVIARYFQLYFVNNSGGTMAASGNSAEYWPLAIDQA